MDRNSRQSKVANTAPSPPTAAWLFAQAVLGNPIPDPHSAQREARADRELLKFLAAISTRHEEELRAVLAQEAAARREREMIEWLAGISTRHEEQLRRVLESEAAQRAAAARMSAFLKESQDVSDSAERLFERDPAEHPRDRIGRFTDKGSGQYSTLAATGASGAVQLAGYNAPETYHDTRVNERIKSVAGNQWSGRNVLDVVKTLAPQWLPFIEQYVTLRVASDNADKAATTVRQGEFGAKLEQLPKGPLNTKGKLTIHFEIPAKWTDIEVTQFILRQLADHDDVHRITAHWSNRKGDLFGEITHQRFKNGLSTIATLAGSYYTALAGLTPGGQVAVVAWDIQEKNYLAAAFGAMLLLPIGKIVKAGAEATGVVAIHAGEKLVGYLPMEVIEDLGKLAPEQKELLAKRLLAAESEEDAANIINKFLAQRFEKHHALPMFLGGELKQFGVKIPKHVHDEFHAVLREELRAVGFDLPIGTKLGSTEKWRALLDKDPSNQIKAFNAVIKASRAMDVKHGTRIMQWVSKNILEKRFIPAAK